VPGAERGGDQVYARQIAEALEYAHERGVIHLDFKPADIKVTPDGVVKLLDFGLAKALDNTPPTSATSPTRLRSHWGTASPDRFSGRRRTWRRNRWKGGRRAAEWTSESADNAHSAPGNKEAGRSRKKFNREFNRRHLIHSR